MYSHPDWINMPSFHTKLIPKVYIQLREDKKNIRLRKINIARNHLKANYRRPFTKSLMLLYSRRSLLDWTPHHTTLLLCMWKKRIIGWCACTLKTKLIKFWQFYVKSGLVRKIEHVACSGSGWQQGLPSLSKYNRSRESNLACDH